MRYSLTVPCLLAAATLGCQFLGSSVGRPTAGPPPTFLPANPTSGPTAPLPTQSASLSPAGPWIVFSKSDGWYAANLDGSGSTKVFDLTPYLKLDPTPYIKLSSIASAGGRFALVTADDASGTHALTLHLLHLPDGKEEKTIPLTGPQSEPGPNAAPDDPRMYPLRVFGTSEWSPDGSQLAFEGGIDGDSSDLYLYSSADGSIQRLTSGSAQDYDPSW